MEERGDQGPQDTSDVGHDISFAVRWKNFRALTDTDWITVKPLTLLLGANGAGKSSFLAPLLLLKQSLDSRTGMNALLTRGEYLDVGVFEDFVTDHVTSRDVTFGLRWHSHRRGSQELAPPGSYPPGGLEVGFGAGEDPYDVVVRSYKIEDTYRRQLLKRTLGDDGLYSSRMVTLPRSVRRSGKTKRASKKEVAKREAMQHAIRHAIPTDFLFKSQDVRRAATRSQSEADRPTFSTTIDDDRSRFYCAIADYVEWNVDELLEDLHYVGPLRDAPRRVYPLSGEMPDAVGTRGEFAAEIIYRWRNDKRRMRELRRWLQHFGFEGDIRFEDVGTSGFSLSLVRGGAQVASPLVDVGFGVSQVLPLVVQGMQAQPGDWIVMEQPEVHLNPRLQAALADLCAYIVERGVGLVLESHSEHLLLRLRRLIAEARIDADKTGLYFVEQDGGQSRIREVVIDTTGFIKPEQWPKGFFEDSLREALALAQEQSRARARSGNGDTATDA